MGIEPTKRLIDDSSCLEDHPTDRTGLVTIVIVWTHLPREVQKSNFRLMDRCSDSQWKKEPKKKELVDRKSKCAKGRKFAKCLVFSMLWGTRGSKIVGLLELERRAPSHLGGWEMKSCTPLAKPMSCPSQNGKNMFSVGCTWLAKWKVPAPTEGSSSQMLRIARKI